MQTNPGPVALFLPSLAGGGGERVVLNLASGFAAQGLRTDLILASATGPYLTSVPASVRIVDLGAARVLYALPRLTRYLRRERPVALIAALNHANVVAMLAARASRVHTPTIISIHNTLSSELLDTRLARMRLLPQMYYALRHWPQAIVAVSEGVADDFSARTGIARNCIDVIQNPVITPQLHAAIRAPAPHPWFDSADPPIVLGIGRLTAQKNFSRLIDAFAIVRRRRPARLVILGDGPERELLEAKVRELGLGESVLLPGFVANPYACIARSRVFVLSSDYEGLPTVLIESLAIGTPVVATDCPSGPREILRNGELGRLVPLGDVDALAEAIADTLDAPRPSCDLEALRSFTLDTALTRFKTLLERTAGLNGHDPAPQQIGDVNGRSRV